MAILATRRTNKIRTKPSNVRIKMPNSGQILMHFPIITSKCQDNFQMLLCALLVPTYVTRMHPRLDDLAISMNCQQQLEGHPPDKKQGALACYV